MPTYTPQPALSELCRRMAQNSQTEEQSRKQQFEKISASLERLCHSPTGYNHTTRDILGYINSCKLPDTLYRECEQLVRQHQPEDDPLCSIPNGLDWYALNELKSDLLTAIHRVLLA